MTRTTAPRSFYFYDLETSGIDPRWDRVMQFAGLRTDANLVPLGDELTSFVKLPVDVLPNPESVSITGLTPQRVNVEGLEEFEAFDAIERALSVPGTCSVGFNNLRFDDEFLRYGFYRHFIDPYAREFRDGNSRWDVIDLMRATAALRPDGIRWPEQDGQPSFRLELFTAANGIEHGHAHDAMADVRATVDTARLLREAQPRLFDYYLGLRHKVDVLEVLRPGLGRPCVHVSGRLPRERRCLAIVLPIAVRPDNANAVVAVDLCRDFSRFRDCSSEELRDVLFSSGDHERPGVKEIRVNRCPFVAPLNVLRPADCDRLGLDREAALARAAQFAETPELGRRLLEVFSGRFETRPGDMDVDAGLYDGFFSDADRARIGEVRNELRRGALPSEPPVFDDERLPELLFRVRARRHGSDLALKADERVRWRAQVRDRLRGATGALGLAEYRAAIDGLAQQGGARELIAELERHGSAVEAWLEEPAGV